ncbi:uncharacterized protein LOC131060394 isoform X2 [Cryptomeria japonica]|uniref:uncharacterized protein LOC131060394 isoform X2 n=1 Tax=Cryptomeria japonica TaxID=3369 RepID=UPI0025AD51FC|nr:uncharacterized protein LOC131060394 isoform X2 [Cryptomeria japonica]
MSSSSSDEDGDEKWRAAVNSIAVDFDTNFTNKKSNGDSKRDEKGKSNSLKLYQSRAQDLLHNYLDNTLTIIPSSELQPHVADSPMVDADDDIRLFRRAPVGITLKPDERLPASIPRKKPRIPPRQEINEKSTEFKFQLQSVAVDGTMILAEAEKNRRKALARLEAKECAAQIAARKEEERVALLKQQRGEKWLPSIGKEMVGDVQAKPNNLQKQCTNLGKKHFDNNKLNRNKDHVNGKHQES